MTEILIEKITIDVTPGRELIGEWIVEEDDHWADNLTDKEACEEVGLDYEQTIVLRSENGVSFAGKDVVKYLEEQLIKEIMGERND